MTKQTITNIVLAGGLSSRMGSNKATLMLGNTNIIENIINEINKFSSETVIVTNDLSLYKDKNWTCVSDVYTQKGPLAGIHAGIINSNNDLNFVISCDMPFPNGQLISKMLPHALLNDIVVPVIYGKLHPLFGFYKKSILSELINCLENDELRVRRMYENLTTYYINEKELYTPLEISSGLPEKDFFNMNTTEDYNKAIDLYNKMHK